MFERVGTIHKSAASVGKRKSVPQVDPEVDLLKTVSIGIDHAWNVLVTAPQMEVEPFLGWFHAVLQAGNAGAGHAQIASNREIRIFQLL